MIETDSPLNFEFDSLELICYLVLGIWYFSSLCSMRYALCHPLYADSVRRGRPSRPPPDGPQEAQSPHIDFHTPHIQIPVWSRISGEGQIP